MNQRESFSIKCKPRTVKTIFFFKKNYNLIDFKNKKQKILFTQKSKVETKYIK